MMGISDEMIRQKVKLHRFLNFDHISINLVPKDCANLIFFRKNYKKILGHFLGVKNDQKNPILKKNNKKNIFYPKMEPKKGSNFFLMIFFIIFLCLWVLF